MLLCSKALATVLTALLTDSATSEGLPEPVPWVCPSCHASLTFRGRWITFGLPWGFDDIDSSNSANWCANPVQRCASVVTSKSVDTYSVWRISVSIRSELATEFDGRAVGARPRSLRPDLGCKQADLVRVLRTTQLRSGPHGRRQPEVQPRFPQAGGGRARLPGRCRLRARAAVRLMVATRRFAAVLPAAGCVK